MINQIIFDPIFLEVFFFILSALFSLVLGNLFELKEYLSIMSIHVIILFLFLLLEIIDPMFYLFLIIELMIIVYIMKNKGDEE